MHLRLREVSKIRFVKLYDVFDSLSKAKVHGHFVSRSLPKQYRPCTTVTEINSLQWPHQFYLQGNLSKCKETLHQRQCTNGIMCCSTFLTNDMQNTLSAFVKPFDETVFWE